MAYKNNIKRKLERTISFCLMCAFAYSFVHIFWLGTSWQAYVVQARAITDFSFNNGATQSSVTVGGRVWLDNNGDGIQGAGEPGIASVGIVLFDTTGTLIGSRFTDKAGIYRFNELESGSYYAILDQETLPDHFVPTLPDIGDDVNDSDLLLESGRTAPTVSIPAGGQFLSLDMGVYGLATLGSRIWEDLNGDGIQDVQESGLRDVVVQLLDDQGQPAIDAEKNSLIATTDENGQYYFSFIQPGRYLLQFTRPGDYVFSPYYQGDDERLDSDGIPSPLMPSLARSIPFTLSPNQNAINFDLGLYRTTSVDGFAWFDSDGNGIWDDEEERLFELPVELYRRSGDLVARSQTDDSGHYTFSELVPGDYYIQFIGPDHLICTHRLDNSNQRRNTSLVDPTNGRIILEDLTIGADYTDLNAGFTEPTALEDQVWLDENDNGRLDPDEAGLADVIVELYDSNNQLVAISQSDQHGFFQFTDLISGDYTVQVRQPAQYEITHLPSENTQNDPSPDNQNEAVEFVQSAIDPVTGNIESITLYPGLQRGVASVGLRNIESIDSTPATVTLISHSVQQVITKSGTQEVVIRWLAQTESNVDDQVESPIDRTVEGTPSAGYYIYRSTDSERANAVRITPELLLSRSMKDNTYEWVDSAVLPNVIYQYWLVSVNGDDESAEFGPMKMGVAQSGIDSLATHQTPSRGQYIFLPLVYGD